MASCAPSGNDADLVGVSLSDGTIGIPMLVNSQASSTLGVVKNVGLKSEYSVLTLVAGSMNEGGNVVGTGAVWDIVG